MTSLRNLEANLILQGDDPARMPLIVQYNKRDLPRALSRVALRRELGIAGTVRQFEACAVKGVGVFETFKAITKACMKAIGDPRDLPEGRSTSMLPVAAHSSMFPLAALGPLSDDAARDYAARLGVEVPKTAPLPRVGALR